MGDGTTGNEEADKLVVAGAGNPTPDEIDLTAPHLPTNGPWGEHSTIQTFLVKVTHNALRMYRRLLV